MNEKVMGYVIKIQKDLNSKKYQTNSTEEINPDT